MPTKYHFSDVDGESGGISGEDRMGQGKGQNSGCYVSVATGFVLSLLAVLIAVGVGLVVHFAEKDGRDRDVTCNFPEKAFAGLLQQVEGERRRN